MARRLLVIALVALLVPSLLTAQRPQTRQGFWFNGGLGWGSAGCDGCGGREEAPTMVLAVGGTLNQKFLLGASIDGWSKSEGGTTLTIVTLLARLRWYPSARGGFFVTGGLGIGTVDAESGGLSGNENGTGALLGIGYDIRIGRMTSLTPFWNGFATHTSSADFNVGQIGLSITTH
jgi:hypothetical protein